MIGESARGPGQTGCRCGSQFNEIGTAGCYDNRWIDASGVCEMPEEAHRQSGKRLAERGYVF